MKNIKIVIALSFFFLSAKSFSQLYGFVNEQNNYVIQPKFVAGREFRDGLAAVQYTNKGGWTRWQFINEKGDFAMPHRFWSVRDYNNGYATVEWVLDFWGVVDKSGKIILKPKKVELIPVVEDGMIRFKKGQYGFYNTEGKTVVKPVYDDAKDFSNGFALVKLSNRFGYLDKLGNVAIPIKYENATSYVNGKAYASQGKSYFELNSEGKEVLTTVFAFNDAMKEQTKKESEYFDYNKPIVNLNKSLQLRKEDAQSSNNNSNNPQYGSNISTSSYALDLFSELGSMAIYVGSTMYVVKIKGKTMGDQGIVSAKAAKAAGVNTDFKYQWFPGKNCTTLKSEYGATFTVICSGEVDLNK